MPILQVRKTTGQPAAKPILHYLSEEAEAQIVFRFQGAGELAQMAHTLPAGLEALSLAPHDPWGWPGVTPKSTKLGVTSKQAQTVLHSSTT